jgi:hypothetical protein
MILFKIWLESRDDIIFASWWRDGRVIVYIHGKRYVYLTDTTRYFKWKQIAKYRPWDVLNEIKQMVKEGLAWQLEPKIEANQKQLF